MRVGCFMFLAGIAMVVFGCWGGAQGAYVWATNLSKTEMTCAEYVEQRPSASWIALTECRADVIASVVESDRITDRVERIWLPMYPIDAEPGGPVALVFESDSPEVIGEVERIASTLEGVGEEPADMLKALVALEKASAMDVEGLVVFGFDMDDDDYAQVAGLAPELGGDFAVLRDGETPSLMGALLYFLMAIVGFVLLFFMVAAAGASEE